MLSATIREQTESYNATFPSAAPLIDKNTFMGDFAPCVENENGAIIIYYDLTAMMKLINLPLAKWATNTEELNAPWKAEGLIVEAETQVLGVRWKTEADYLYIDADEIISKLKEGSTTKRKLLQTTAIFYNPLGLFCLVALVRKILFRTPGVQKSTGTSFCLQTWEHDGTLGYLVCLLCHTCTFPIDLLLQWNEDANSMYSATPPEGHTERLSTFVQPKKTTPLSIWPATRTD